MNERSKNNCSMESVIRATTFSPDVTVSFLSLQVREERKNRVRVSGARGRPATSSYKVDPLVSRRFLGAGNADDFRPRSGGRGRRVAAVKSFCSECAQPGISSSGRRLNASAPVLACPGC